MEKGERYKSVWDALEDTPEQAANMRFRSELMINAKQVIRDSGLTQKEAAKRAGVTQPRMSDLLRGRIDKFSVDALINVLEAFDRRVEPKITEIEEGEPTAVAV